MPDTATPATVTRPARKRAPSKPAAPAVVTETATVTPPVTVEPVAEPGTPAVSAPVAVERAETKRVGLVLTYSGSTKSYDKFVVDDETKAATGCAGTLYVPLGTSEVRVLVLEFK
jgi:septal ring-binding cell division protein DamX